MEHPQPPSELRVYATDSANDLIWSASRSERIVGYTIEAAPSASGPWQPLTTKASPSLAFRDVSPAVPGTTFYRVTATDAHGLVSEPTIPVSFTRSAPVPAAPPAAPAQRAPLLVAENVPNAVEPESVIFTGSLPAWGRDGTGLVFGAAGPTTAVPSIAGEAAITGMDGVSVVTGSAGTPFTPEQRKVGGSPYFAEGQLIPGAEGTLVLPSAAPVAVVEQSKVAERQRNDEVAFDPFTFGVLAALSAFAIGRRIRRSTRMS